MSETFVKPLSAWSITMLPETFRTQNAFLLVVVFLGCLISGCTSRTTSVEIAAPDIVEIEGKFIKEYVLVPGDRIEVSVWQVPEVSRTVQIRPDGRISLPTVSGVQAAGKTFDELETTLTERLSERLNEPIVTVIGVDIRQNMVYVVGDVPRPGALPIRDAASASEAISLAGGFMRTGAARSVSIIRLHEDGVIRATPVEVIDDGEPTSYMALVGMALQPDDVIFVPESNRSEAIRWLDDFIGRPLGYINLIGNSVFNYRIIRDNF